MRKFLKDPENMFFTIYFKAETWRRDPVTIFGYVTESFIRLLITGSTLCTGVQLLVCAGGPHRWCHHPGYFPHGLLMRSNHSYCLWAWERAVNIDSQDKGCKSFCITRGVFLPVHTQAWCSAHCLGPGPQPVHPPRPQEPGR